MNMRQNISSSVSKKYITEKNQKTINYPIEEWHTSTPYDILRNQSTYTTVCLLIYTWKQTDHCIIVCGKWIFDSNLKVALPLTQVCFNCILCGNGTDENRFIGVLHKTRSVPYDVVERRLNMK